MNIAMFGNENQALLTQEGVGQIKELLACRKQLQAEQRRITDQLAALTNAAGKNWSKVV